MLGTLHLVGHKNFLGTGKNGLDLRYSNLRLQVSDTTVTGAVGGKTGNEVDGSAFISVDMGKDPGAFARIVIGVLAALGLVAAGIAAGIGAIAPILVAGGVPAEATDAAASSSSEQAAGSHIETGGTAPLRVGGEWICVVIGGVGH